MDQEPSNKYKFLPDHFSKLPGFKHLTPGQREAILQAFEGNLNSIYLERRRLVTTLTRLKVAHDLTVDRWAQGMYEHYQKVLEILESYLIAIEFEMSNITQSKELMNCDGKTESRNSRKSSTVHDRSRREYDTDNKSSPAKVWKSRGKKDTGGG